MQRKWMAAMGLALVGSTAQAADAPLATVTLAPSELGRVPNSGKVAVTMDVPGIDAPAGTQLVTIGTWVPGMARPLEVTGMTVADDAGPVPLTRGPGGQGLSDNSTNGWVVGRAVKGTLKVNYTVNVENVPLLRGGPPVQPRIDGESVSSVGSGLIAGIATSEKYRVAVRWDLAAAGDGARGVTSWGDGDVQLDAGSLERLGDTVFMAGKLRSTPDPAQGPFLAVWGGNPPFDPAPSMGWASRLHTWMSHFWGDTSEPPYRVFIRENPMNAGGGAAFPHSFLMTWGKGVDGEKWKPILGHEMTHTWTALESIGKFYSEGNAVYYQSRLPWRAGLTTTADYLADLNETAARYYTNAMRSTPEAEVLPRFWEDTRIRVLPYDRGAMYFAALDGMVRRKNAGKRSIDDLIKAMNARAAGGAKLTEADWLAMLDTEIGKPALDLHRTMMAGGLVLPQSDDFGPCFRRTTKPIRQFDLGFDNASLLGDTKVIKGLKLGSEAEKAGLRNGDVIAYGVSLDQVQAEQQRMLDLTVTRDGKTFALSYLPRGTAVPAYQWEIKPGVDADTCRS